MLVLLAGYAAAPRHSAAAFDVRYAADTLSVRLAGEPMDRVLAEIGRQTGIAFRGALPARHVSVQFDALPLQDGLRRVLGEQSFALVYGPGDRIRAVRLIAPPSGLRVSEDAGTRVAMVPAPRGDAATSILVTPTAPAEAAAVADEPFDDRGPTPDGRARLLAKVDEALRAGDERRLWRLLHRAGRRAPALVMELVAAASSGEDRRAALDVLHALRSGAIRRPATES